MLTKVLPFYQDAEERQGGSGGHQTRQGPGGRKGHVLCKNTSVDESVCVSRLVCVLNFVNDMFDYRRAAVLAGKGESSERRD